MTTPKQIFATNHNPTTIVRVIFGRKDASGGIGLDVLLNGRIVLRCYDPSEVTAWFDQASKKNTAAWRAAYHRADIDAVEYKRPKPIKTDIILPVRYLSQRDNERHPFGTCNVSSYAMCFDYHGVKRKRINGKLWAQREDELEAFLASKGRDRHVHDDLAWMGREYGLNASFRTNRTWDEIRQQIRQENPVIVSGLYTSSGHIIVIIGIKGNDFVVHDSFGNALKNYRGDGGRDGEGLLYPFDFMHRKTRNPGSEQKWGHFLSK